MQSFDSPSSNRAPASLSSRSRRTATAIDGARARTPGVAIDSGPAREGAEGRARTTAVWGLWLDQAVVFAADTESVAAGDPTAFPASVVQLEDDGGRGLVEGDAERVEDPRTLDPLCLRVRGQVRLRARSRPIPTRPSSWYGRPPRAEPHTAPRCHRGRSSSTTRACPSCPRSRRFAASSSRRSPAGRSSRSRSATSAGPGPAPPAEVERALAGRRIDAVDRRGKYLLLRLYGDRTLAMHLRMTGNLLLQEPGSDLVADLEGAVPPARRGCTRAGRRCAIFAPRSSSTTARECCSPTRGGSARRSSSTATAVDEYLAARIGVEPLSGSLTAEEVCRLASGRRAPLKSFLLNQKGIAGIGNIYADEALHRAALHPLSPAGSMKPEDCERLRDAIVATLEAGLRNGGASIDDYLDARGERGAMQDEFLVHTREGEPCHAMRRRDPTDRGRRALDVLLFGLPAAASTQAPAAALAMIDPTAPPRRLPGRSLDRLVGCHGLHGRNRAAGQSWRGGRARRRAGNPGDRRDRPARRDERGDRGHARRRQRLRPRRRGRRDALA